MFVNGADTKAAQIFTLAHELAHLWLGETALCDADRTVPSSIEVERWCSRVANEVLGPSASLTENGGHGTRPVRISERFAKAVVTSTLEGGTLYTEAFEMLSVKKLSVFDELASRLAVS